MKTSKIFKSALAAAAVFTLVACSSHTKVSADGSTDEPRWPKAESSTFNKNLVIFPDPSSLAQVKAGVTKDQLYYLLGRPHYNEGFVGVREWNYLMHFRTPGQGTNDVTTCQFKVLFDKKMVAQSFYWNPIDPSTASCPPAAAPATVAAPSTQRYTMNGDALFAFNRSGTADLLSGARGELDNLASRISKFDRLSSVVVVGHTDRIGSDNYNLSLSQRRAQTVANYLSARGVPADVIRAEGVGEAQPVVECSDKLGRSELIACLQPNRRVEIQVTGSGVLN